MSTRGPLPGFEDRAPRDRYCDLILTGGVTSSIAYPAAIFALAMVYRFNSIGGASSGAGAAALAAAAEYRRRHGSSDGFRIMLERAAEVAEKVEGGKTRLEWLFQPEEENRRLFGALLPGFAAPSGKLKALAGGLLRAYAKILLAIAAVFLIAGIVALAAAALGCVGGPWGLLIGIGGTTLFFVTIVVTLAVLFARDVGRIVRYDYGLCSGSGSRDAPVPPFTDWLHSLIQEIAGRRTGERPLTFADLAAAPGSPRETLNDPSPAGAASISLQMFTANVTHGRPYVFPQNEGGEDDLPLFFRSSEMSRLFPPDVVRAMEVDPVTGQSNKYDGDAKPAEKQAQSHPGEGALFLCDRLVLVARHGQTAGRREQGRANVPAADAAPAGRGGRAHERQLSDPVQRSTALDPRRAGQTEACIQALPVLRRGHLFELSDPSLRQPDPILAHFRHLAARTAHEHDRPGEHLLSLVGPGAGVASEKPSRSSERPMERVRD